MKKLVLLTTLLIGGAVATSAESAEETRKRFEQEFQHIPVPELPAFAAEVIKRTPAAERSQAAIIAVQTVAERHPAASASVASAITTAAPETRAALTAANSRGGSETGRQPGNGNSSPNGNANGGVGLGPGPNKPGQVVVHDRPIKTILPNGKPRHFPPDPPNRPVDPPRPHKYNKPKPH
jgi:hypothetical protein